MNETRKSSLLGKITAILVMFCLVIVSLTANTAVALPGSGTKDKPWRIKSLVDFDEFAADANYWAGYTCLETDVNLAGRTYTTAVIAPDTGNVVWYLYYGLTFTGSFNGNGHKIINLTIDDGGAGNNYLGLFGYIDNGGIWNVGIEGGSVSGGAYVGGLAGRIQNSSISNCYSTLDVSGETSDIGGLVGTSDRGGISNCYSTGSVIGDYHVGGLIGHNRYGFVSNCYSKGDVNGNDDVGGLLGDNGGSVSNCYSTGDVSGDYEVGGLMGLNTGSVSNCFWNIDTQTHDITKGIGFNYEGTVTNVSGLNTAQMQIKNTFTGAGWDFIDEYTNGTSQTWQMPVGGGYPVLSFFHIDIPLPLAGSGTLNDPYLVSDANDFGMVSWYPADCHFKLTGDVDLLGIHWSVAVVPIFTGSFDGNGHKVLNIEISGGSRLGLFGYLINRGRIRDLCIDGGSVSGDYFVGGLVGYNWDGSISNCYSTVDVSGEWDVGGLVGINGGMVCDPFSCWWSGGRISDCYSTGSVSGNGNVGGLVGDNSGSVSNCYSISCVTGNVSVGGLVGGGNQGSVSKCFSAGDVMGDESVGGLVGWNDSGTFTNCYSTASVFGNVAVGGLVGANYKSTIANCYSTGTVTGTDDIGGLVGSGRYTPFWDLVRSSFWDVESSGQLTSAGGTGKTTAEMKTADTFWGWGSCDNGGVWTIDEGNDYPRLVWEYEPGRTLPKLSDLLEGSGTESDPYMIYTAEQLNAIGLSVCDWDKHFKLMADIDLNGNTLTEFNMIGCAGIPFAGVFNGNDRTVSNLRLYLQDVSSAGLFSHVGSEGHIKNFCLENVDVNIVNGGYVGGLVGENHGTLTDCYSTGTVTAKDFGWERIGIGGLVGHNVGGIKNCYSIGSVSGIRTIGGLVGENKGTISDCWATGNTIGDGYVGGLVGENEEGIITNCYSTGSVSGIGLVGGLVGYNSSPATIMNCCSASSVRGERYVGGLVGVNQRACGGGPSPICSYGTIINCYSTGSVSGSVDNVGGLVGINYGPITNSYSTGSVSGLGNNVGGLVGNNQGTVSNCYSTGTVAGTNYAGGFVGRNSGPISNCYATGGIEANMRVGGFVGRNSGPITNCYSRGSVFGYDYVGGLVGWNRDTIIGCYSTGAVLGYNDVGGLVGYHYLGEITDSFWDIETSGLVWSDGGTGLPTDQMQMAGTFTNAGWDFVGETVNGIEDLWFIPQQDYPRLWWEGMQVPMKLSPGTLNCRSKGKWFKTSITLPQGFTVEDVDSDRPAVLHSFGFQSAPLHVSVTKNKQVQIDAAFERQALCSLTGDWPQTLTVAGFLADGNIFLGTSKVRIIAPTSK